MKKESNAVSIWLLIGVGMLVIQVLLGGITRLTGSGLSITEWKPLMGAIPPLNETEWMQAFEKYKQIGQYKHINFDFSLNDFKFIFFWEWFHREWARLIAVVFAIPFAWFIIKGKFKKEMIKPMLILFLLGAMQGAIGWIMVASGLNDESLYVNHIKLAIHFISAMVLVCYTLWFALQLLVPQNQLVNAPSLKKYTLWLTAIIVVQLVFGAFMAGLKAATFATTWPLINGEVVPASMYNDTFIQMMRDPLAVHFIHRTMAYIIAIIVFVWYLRAKKITATPLFKAISKLPLILVILQIVLGILTVLNANDHFALLWLGVSHQLVGMMLLLTMVTAIFFNKKLK